MYDPAQLYGMPMLKSFAVNAPTKLTPVQAVANKGPVFNPKAKTK